MDDVFSCGETAWELINDRSYSLLRKKFPSLKGNPERCSQYLFVCGVSSTGPWFAFVSHLLYDQNIPNIHFLYYLSAYTLGLLPVLALHKVYERNISKSDFPKWTFLTRMILISIYGITITPIMSFISFPLLVNLLCILGLGISHGALLGGLSQLASVFPSSCNGSLLLGQDLTGVVPLLLVSIVALSKASPIMSHIIFIVSPSLSLCGIISLILLLRSEMASMYLGNFSKPSLKSSASIEGLENLLSRSGGDEERGDSDQYVSLSSFLSPSPATTKQYTPAMVWGIIVFFCTFCTYFMVPFFPEAKKTHAHFPIFLFFVQHFSDISGRELLCGLVKTSVKTKFFMWILVILRTLIIFGWIAEVLFYQSSSIGLGALEIGALVLCGLVGGSVNPSVYLLAGVKNSDDYRDSIRAIHCCMWCSVAGSLTALFVVNMIALSNGHSLSWGN